jgi:Tfp pilus assembly protein PilO
MDLEEVIRYRTWIGVSLAVALLIGWHAYGYRPRSERIRSFESREEAIARDRAQVLAQIAQAQAEVKQPKSLPSRAVPAPSKSMSAVDRLNYFLDNITKPANALELSYFTVTPLPPASGAGYEEIPFSITVAGNYAALADYLYQLEYGQDFIVRDLAVTQRESQIQADFRLSALLLSDPNTQPAAKTAKDPGRPTSLELARDPFVRPPAKVAVGPDGKSYFLNVPAGLRLSGIMMKSSGPTVAIINHEPYPVGASIQNKTITKITDRGVELSDKVRSYFLEMEQPAYSTTLTAKTKEASVR